MREGSGIVFFCAVNLEYGDYMRIANFVALEILNEDNRLVPLRTRWNIREKVEEKCLYERLTTANTL